MITAKQEIISLVRELYNENCIPLCDGYFLFDVDMPKEEILKAYRDLQRECSGHEVVFPHVEGTYTGCCADFLTACNNRQGYHRYDDRFEYEFIY